MKITQSCPTLCDATDYTVHGILQARVLEWVAFPFSRGSSQPEIEPRSPALQEDSLPAEAQGKPKNTGVGCPFLLQGIFPTQGSNPGLPHCRILYQLSHKWKLVFSPGPLKVWGFRPATLEMQSLRPTQSCCWKICFQVIPRAAKFVMIWQPEGAEDNSWVRERTTVCSPQVPPPSFFPAQSSDLPLRIRKGACCLDLNTRGSRRTCRLVCIPTLARPLLSSPLYRWGNWGSGRLSDDARSYSKGWCPEFNPGATVPWVYGLVTVWAYSQGNPDQTRNTKLA